MATLAIGVTVPSSSTWSGTFFFSATAVMTGTPRACGFGRGAWATAPCGFQMSRVTTAPPARASTTATPTSQVRFFIL